MGRRGNRCRRGMRRGMLDKGEKRNREEGKGEGLGLEVLEYSKH